MNIKETAKKYAQKATEKAKEIIERIRAFTLDKWNVIRNRIQSVAKKKSKKKSTSKKSVKKRQDLAKNPVKRFFYKLHPKRVMQFWFSKKGLKTMGQIGAIGLALFILAVLYVAKDLPSPGEVNASVQEQSTKIYDRTGKHLLYDVYGDYYRDVVEIDQMSDNIKNATIAIEDKEFYDHGAVDFSGIGRAAFNNLFNRDQLQGGSTITQQYVKNALLTSERTFVRKFKELILSIQLEQLYEKDEILELYLNEIAYGPTVLGVEAAADIYFEKDATELTVDESAMLAAIPRSPVFYNPYGENREALINRRNIVINLMQEQGYVTEEEANKAKETDTIAKLSKEPSLYRDIEAPHFVLEVQKQLEEKYGTDLVRNGGLKVITTLDVDKQEAAEKAVRENMDPIRAGGGNNAALVSVKVGTGQVVAMVGSHDFFQKGYGSFNAAMARRQPGSSFKPFVYSEAFKDNWGPGSVMYDVRTNFGGTPAYIPRNYTSSHYGALPIRRALGGSLNIPAVKMLYIVGVEDSIKNAEALGITGLENADRCGLSLVLGCAEVRPYDMAQAYSVFANGGIKHKPTMIMKVEDSRGRVLEEWQEEDGERVLDEQVAYEISSILSDYNARSWLFGSLSNFFEVDGVTTAAKTGTTDEARDAWMVGYSRQYTAAVWAGHNDNEPMSTSTSAVTGPIWTQYMGDAHSGLDDQPFERPDGIKTVRLDSHTGRVPNDGTKQTHSDIFASWYRAPSLDDEQTAIIDKVSGKLATECTPERAKEEQVFNGIDTVLSPGDPAYSRWSPPVKALARSLGFSTNGSLPTAKDDVHSCNDEKPAVTAINTSNTGTGVYQIEAEIDQGTFAIDKVNFKVDGQIISSQSGSGSNSYTTSHAFSSTGSHKIVVEVLDKGLYYDDATKTLSVSQTSSSDDDFKNKDPNDGENVGIPGNVTLSWGEHSGANKYTVFVNSPGGGGYSVVSSCDGINNTSCTYNASSIGTYQWRVKAYLGSNELQQTSATSFIVGVGDD